MARIPRHRLLDPFGVFHVTARGVERRSVVLDRDDGVAFLARLADAAGRFDRRVHAFCLMPNHCHLLLEVTRVRAGLCADPRDWPWTGSRYGFELAV